MTESAVQRTPETMELYVRSLSPTAFRANQERVINRLERLEAIGAIGDYTVEVWGDRLAEPDVHRTETGRRISGLIERFRSWADDQGMSVSKFFDTETVRSKVTDEEYSQIAFPAMTLAEYGPDGLEFVTPCSDGEIVHGIRDRLDAIEAASPLESASRREDASLPEPE